MKKITIAIDGYSSCGKSTMAKDLAKEIGYVYVDTGAMYRSVALYALRHQLFEADGAVKTEELQKEMKNISISFKFNETTGRPDCYLNGELVEKEIRSLEVSNHVSPIAAVPFVREALVEQQQKMGEDKGIVMDGRDIGTTVFPNAELKIFVTASSQVRAQRRFDELKEKGYDKLKTYGVGKDLSYKEWKEYLYQMLQLGYIEIDYMSAGHLKVTPLGRKVLFGEQQALMTIYQKIKDFALPTKKGGYKYRPIRPIESTSVDETLLDPLQQLRKQIAEREHTPAYILFSDDALEDMVRKKPVTLDEFSEIRGVGQLKLDKYGKVFVALIRFVLRLPKKE